MSKELKSIQFAGAGDNDAQLKATQEIVDNYDQHAARILRKEQAKVNQQLQQQRNEHHQSYQEIEAQANAILQRAHREGEVHVVERHRKTASIFYIENNKIMMWLEGISVELEIPIMSKDATLIAVRVSDWVFANLSIKKDEEALGSVFFTYHHGNSVFAILATLIKKLKTSDYYLSEGSVIPLIDQIHDMFVTSNGWHGMSIPKKITGYWIEKANESDTEKFSTKFTSQIEEPWKKLVTALALPKNELRLYLILSKGLHSLKIKANQSTIDEKEATLFLDAKHMDTPIDLALNTEHNSLFIQDAEKKDIGIHLLDFNKERIWRSFSDQSQITLPPGVFQLETKWTISCLVKRNCNLSLIRKPPSYNTPFKVWVDELSGLLKLQYSIDGKDQTFTSPAQTNFKDNRYADWFLFSMQREGDTIRFYTDGELFWTHQAIQFPVLRGKKLVFSLTGYFLCEMRVWRTIRTPDELKRYQRVWLPNSAYHGLTGYWHLFVVGEENTGLMLNTFDKNGNKTTPIQEPDLSGNGHHLYTYRGPNVVGDLNRETVLKYKTVGPFPAVMPLYELSTVHQGIDIDAYAGRIYWVDEIGEACSRQRVLMAGGTLGHLAPIPLFKLDSNAPFSVLSRTNSPYEDLIIAHANRRKAMEQQFLGIANQHQASHSAVDAAHDALDQQLSTASMDEIDNTAEYAAVHDAWLQELDRIANEEEQALRTASARRNAALAQAQEMTDLAQRRVITHRRQRK